MKHTIILIAFMMLSFFLVNSSLQSQSLEFTDCFLDDCAAFDQDPGIRFGYFYVNENHTDPTSRLLRMAFVKLEAREQNQNTPILFLDGGPGGRTLHNRNIRLFAAHPFRNNHDIYLTDFRGLGHSQPEICPGLENNLFQTLSLDLTPEQARQMGHDIFFECFEALMNEGLDLNQFNTATVVKDLEILRNQLGIKQWNLWGISYGTRVAQTYMRDYPNSVRSAIHDSPVPVGLNFPLTYLDSYRKSLNELFSQCASDPQCNKSFPNLEQDFYATMESLKTQPFFIETSVVPQGSVTLGFSDMHLIVHQLLYANQLYPVFPWFMKVIKERNQEFMRNLLPALLDRLLSTSRSIYQLVSKYDLGPLYTIAEQDTSDPLYQALNFFYTDYYIKGKMDFVRIDSLEGYPVTSSVPSLILSGEFDPITPPSHAFMLHANLRNSYLFTFPGQGHGLTMLSDCAREITLQFLDNPDIAPDKSCIAQLETSPVMWVTDIYFNTHIATFVSNVINKPKIATIAGPGLLMLAFLLSLIMFVVNLFRKRNISRSEYRGGILSRTTAFIFILLFAGIFYFVKETASVNGFMVLLGLLPQARWLFLLSFAALTGTALSLYFFVKSFKDQSAFQRIISGFMPTSLVWCSVIVLQYQLWPW
ncbi:MAG: alpha/beta fold hydrolase [Bacteroidales bacterium]